MACPQQLSTGTVPNRYGGTDYDSESNLYHATNRQYPAAQGRWLSPDPLAGSSADPQSLNRYTYVKNSPLVFSDPLGLYGVFAQKPPGVNLCIWTASTDKRNSDQDSAQGSAKGPGGPSAEESSSEEAPPAPDCVGFQGYMSMNQIFAYYDGYDSGGILGSTVGGPGPGTLDGVDLTMFQSTSDPTSNSAFTSVQLSGVSTEVCSAYAGAVGCGETTVWNPTGGKLKQGQWEMAVYDCSSGSGAQCGYLSPADAYKLTNNVGFGTNNPIPWLTTSFPTPLSPSAAPPPQGGAAFQLQLTMTDLAAATKAVNALIPTTAHPVLPPPPVPKPPAPQSLASLARSLPF